MLKLQLKNQTDRYVMLTSGLVTLGRDATNDFVIALDDVSDFHAEVVSEGDRVAIVDLLSESGTFVNERRVGGMHELSAWDVIRLGTAELELNDPNVAKPQDWVLRATSEADLHWDLRSTTVIGRDLECDIALDDDLLSRRHVELRARTEHVHILDLGSANGTYLNGRLVTNALAFAGDEIRIGSYLFELDGAERLRRASPGSDSTESMATRLIDADGGQTEAIEETELIVAAPPARLIEVATGSPLLGEPQVTLRARSYVIGRQDDNDIVLADGSVSKQHARLVLNKGEWQIEDLGSSNGVLVNGAQVERAALRDGDSIGLGRVEFTFEQEASSGAG